MKNTKALLKEIYNRELKVTPKGAINQTQRNTLKNEFMDCLIKDIAKGLGVNVVRLDKGLGLDIQHINEGSLPITIDVVFKNITYDVEVEHQDYLDDKKLKADNKAEREKKAHNKFINDTNARELAKAK